MGLYRSVTWCVCVGFIISTVRLHFIIVMFVNDLYSLTNILESLLRIGQLELGEYSEEEGADKSQVS